MLSDGTNAFTWNARNQVAKLNNVSLQYDAFGRRIQNAAGTSFFYDGANAAQELSGTTVTANLLSGGIDEVFSRTDSSGAFTPLKDALGSTIALADSSGNLQTTYTYDPFGNTSVTGTSNGNEFQYTGRENEGNGLYFYRARYYSPFLHRFISQDPLGFAGSGPNLYAYAGNSPINFRDPTGLAILPCALESTLCGAANNSDSHKSTRGDTFWRPNWLQCWAMDLVGWDTTCVQGPNGPIVTTYLSSGTIVTVAYGGLQTNAWGNPSTLQDHFNRHGSDFRSSSPDDYAQQAQDFLIRSQAENLPTKIDADGVIRVYDPVTNEFGAYNADGTTRTYFRPSSTSYFLRQPGVDVKIDTPVQLELPFE